MAEADVCRSCGMPVETPQMHGGGVKENPHCVYCTDAHGRLKSREDVREGMLRLYMDTLGKSREEAEQVVDAAMAEMPAWKEGGETLATGQSATSALLTGRDFLQKPRYDARPDIAAAQTIAAEIPRSAARRCSRLRSE